MRDIELSPGKNKSSLKVDQIETWYSERIGNASYSVSTYGILKELTAAIKDRKAIITDIHRSENLNDVSMELLIPLMDSKNKKAKPFGLLVLSIDPDENLFPIINLYPIPGKTLETLIVRRDRNSIIYINELKIILKIGNLHNSFGDSNLIRIVWNNLISNSIKYSLKNKMSKIVISSSQYDGIVTYSVNDNGVGFDMQYVQNLFEVFQRLHNQGEFDGNGVGQAIVRRIILRHGGQVWAEGEVGKGATFYLSLPVN
jgi:signal transduction histidine kinase